MSKRWHKLDLPERIQNAEITFATLSALCCTAFFIQKETPSYCIILVLCLLSQINQFKYTTMERRTRLKIYDNAISHQFRNRKISYSKWKLKLLECSTNSNPHRTFAFGAQSLRILHSVPTPTTTKYISEWKCLLATEFVKSNSFQQKENQTTKVNIKLS